MQTLVTTKEPSSPLVWHLRSFVSKKVTRHVSGNLHNYIYIYTSVGLR